jgi:hypothetical protein
MLANLQHLTDVYRAGHSQMDGMRMSPCHWEKYRLTLGGWCLASERKWIVVIQPGWTGRLMFTHPTFEYHMYIYIYLSMIIQELAYLLILFQSSTLQVNHHLGWLQGGQVGVPAASRIGRGRGRRRHRDDLCSQPQRLVQEAAVVPCGWLPPTGSTKHQATWNAPGIYWNGIWVSEVCKFVT